MIKKFFKFLLKFFFGLFVFSVAIVVVFKWVPVPITPLMVIRNYEQSQQDKDVVWKHDWVSIDNISKNIDNELKKIGCDTAKSVLELSESEVIRRTDLEDETVKEIFEILKSEFEKDE